jgi:hypothetical protein
MIVPSASAIIAYSAFRLSGFWETGMSLPVPLEVPPAGSLEVFAAWSILEVSETSETAEEVYETFCTCESMALLVSCKLSAPVLFAFSLYMYRHIDSIRTTATAVMAALTFFFGLILFSLLTPQFVF